MKSYSRFSSVFNPAWLKPSLASYLVFCSFVPQAFSTDRYYLCGPDEDGCYEEIAQYCTCTPYNEKEAHKPYCLNFDELTCTPLSEASDCDPDFVYKDQGSCLATIFQSESIPPCPLTSKDYCLNHNTSICASNGLPSSCKPENRF